MCFAVTFLITDILSECEGKKAANKAVLTGILSSVFFLVLSQSWMLYNPSPNDTIMPSIKAVFSNTPRMIFASLTVYAISQLFDVWLYHKWWKFTEKKFGDKRRFLWLRNNGSTHQSDSQHSPLHRFCILGNLWFRNTCFNLPFKLCNLHFHKSARHPCGVSCKIYPR